MDPELTLENAKKKIRQETVREQNQELSSTGIAGESHDNPIGIGYIMKKHHGGPERQQLSQHGRHNPVHHSREAALCTRCGRGQHSRAEYPARDATCCKCGKGDTLALNASPRGRTCRS